MVLCIILLVYLDESLNNDNFKVYVGYYLILHFHACCKLKQMNMKIFVQLFYKNVI